MTRMILVLSMLLTFIGCDDKTFITEIVPEPTESTERQSFDGYFNLNGASDANCIFLVEKIENVVDIESDCQSLVTTNPENGTLGQFPIINATNLLVLNNEIRFTRDVNYSSGNDIEEDVSGSNITGRKRTDFLIKFRENGRLHLEITIFKNANNSNLNEIVAVRKFNEL